MIIIKEKKPAQIIGLEKIKSDDEFDYYISSNPTSQRQKRGINIIFSGNRKECLEFVNNL